MNDKKRFVFNHLMEEYEFKVIFNHLMEEYQFKVIYNDNGTLSVYDLQHACLGNICDEIFKDEFEILERMETYHEEYTNRLLEKDFDEFFDTDLYLENENEKGE